MDETREETLAATRRSKAVEAVLETQQQSVQRGTDTISQAEIDAEIAAVRRARRQKKDLSQ